MELENGAFRTFNLVKEGREVEGASDRMVGFFFFLFSS